MNCEIVATISNTGFGDHCCASKCVGVLFNLVLYHFLIKYYFQNANL